MNLLFNRRVIFEKTIPAQLFVVVVEGKSNLSINECWYSKRISQMFKAKQLFGTTYERYGGAVRIMDGPDKGNVILNVHCKIVK